MRKKINFLRHIAILVLTIMIFSIGIFIGGSVDNLRVQNLYTQLQKQDLEYQNLVTEINYINYLITLKEGGGNISCNLIDGAYFTSIQNLDNSRIKLENYINSGNAKEEEFEILKEHYSNVQVNYWILANKIKNLCDTKTNSILFFYTNKKDCPQCEDQGVHLNYVKAKLKDDILVFSIDAQKSGPIRLIGQKYSVHGNELPILIINDEVYGFKTNQEIFHLLCENGFNNTC